MTDPDPGAGALDHLRDLVLAPEVELTQKEIGPFRVLEQVGRGGMGVVYRALHTGLDRVVALKVSQVDDPDLDADARFVTEAKAAARIDHENVVRVFELGETEGRQYIAMEFVEGQPLSSWLGERSILERKHILECAAIGIGVARGVHAAHAQGVIHRDLKPQNIMITPDNRIKVADFGLACLQQSRSRRTRTGMVFGTLAYIPPEMLRGDRDQVGPASDVYGIGTILYFLLGGAPLFEVEAEAELVNAVLNRDPVSIGKKNRHVDRDLETIVMKCLDKDPVRRYATAAELEADLERYLKGAPIVAKPAGILHRIWKRAVRQRAAVVALLVILIGLGAAGLYAYRTNGDARARSRALPYLESGRRIIEQIRLRKRNPDGSIQDLQDLGHRARLEFVKALQEYPLLPEAHWQTARMHLLVGNDNCVQECLNEALRLNPEFAPARLDRALCHLERAARGGALSFAVPLRDAGAKGAIDRRLDEAREDLRIIIGGQDRGPDVLYAEGLLAIVNRDPNRAEQRIGEYLKAAPEEERALYFRGIALLDANRPKEAIGCFDRVLACNRHYFQAYFQRSRAKAATGDLEGALADSDEAVRRDPNGIYARINRAGVLMDMKNSRAALEDLDWVISHDDREWIAYLNRASLRKTCGDLPGALADAERAVALNPGRVEACLGRGDILEAQANFQAAAADFNRALEIDPGNWDALRRRAPLRANHLSDVKGALQDFETMMRLRPGDPTGIQGRGWIHWAQGEVEAALADYDKAIALGAGATAYHHRAKLRSQLDDLEGGISDCLRCLELAPDPSPDRAEVQSVLEFLRGQLEKRKGH